MTLEHDFKKHPELWTSQFSRFYHKSPHKQITRDFRATVVKVTDGDTIRVETSFRDFDFSVRFANTYAPELGEGGERAREHLEGRILGEDITVKIDPENRVGKWGRIIGTIIHRGLDINQDMKRRRLAQ